MAPLTLCVLGGTGFVGRHLVNRLAREGHVIRVLTRRRERHKELLVLPRVRLVEGGVHDRDALARHFTGCDAVINLVGILNERRKGDFQRVHVELAERVADAALAAGTTRLLHMSALNADPGETASEYLRTKGEAEDRVHAAAGRGLRVTSFRPSVIFGHDDSFFNRFATLLHLAPFVFPLACPEARFAPVYVGDVAEAYARCLHDDGMAGERLELCGPDTHTLKELVRYTAATMGLERDIWGLSDRMSRWQAKLLQRVPGKPFSMDNYHSLQKDSVCRETPWARLGIEPAAIEAVVPLYLGGRRVRARYQDWRRAARRG